MTAEHSLEFGKCMIPRLDMFSNCVKNVIVLVKICSETRVYSQRALSLVNTTKIDIVLSVENRFDVERILL